MFDGVKPDMDFREVRLCDAGGEIVWRSKPKDRTTLGVTLAAMARQAQAGYTIQFVAPKRPQKQGYGPTRWYPGKSDSPIPRSAR